MHGQQDNEPHPVDLDPAVYGGISTARLRPRAASSSSSSSSSLQGGRKFYVLLAGELRLVSACRAESGHVLGSQERAVLRGPVDRNPVRFFKARRVYLYYCPHMGLKIAH
jgi:hypothetical protein